MSDPTVPRPPGQREPRSDAELIDSLRAGDADGTAANELFERHWAAVRRAARWIGGSSDADDIAQETMVRVLEAIEGGSGPDSAFRAYAVATARNVAASWSRGTRAAPAGSAADLDAIAQPGGHHRDVQQSVVDRDLLARSFAQVPERYRTVLWHTVVEGRSPADLTRQYGMSANCVAVTAARARESLRRAWLTVHLTSADAGPDCERILRLLVRLRRGENVPPAARDRLDRHLETCERCRSAAESLDVLVQQLPAALVPLLPLAGSVAGSMPAGSGASAVTTISFKAKLALAAGGVAVIASGVAGLVLSRDDDVAPSPVAVVSQPPAPRSAAPTVPLSPSPTATPGDVAPPTVLAVDREPAWLVPRLAGTGVAGAEVVATDGEGREAGRARVDADGRWRLTPVKLSVGPQELSVSQVVGGRRSAPAERTIEVHLEGPSLSLEDCTPAPDGGGWVVAVRGTPGRHVHAAVDGTGAEAFEIPPDGLVRAVWPGLSAGTHVVEVWYSDPATGRVGGIRTGTANLVAPSVLEPESRSGMWRG